MTRKPIRVLVVEDTRMIREMLVTTLEADPDIQVVGTAQTGSEAIELAKKLRPDVISMDVVLPDISGVDATERIMRSSPTPVVLVTSLESVHEDFWSMKALAKGAVMAVPKPTASLSLRRRYVEDVKAAAATARDIRYPNIHQSMHPPQHIRDTPRPDLLLIGSSTGGPKILSELLMGITGSLTVPVVLVQHISEDFFLSFVSWLRTSTSIPIEVVAAGASPQKGVVYVAPAGSHTIISSAGTLDISHSPPVNHCLPSVTELFRSAVRWKPRRTTGFVLTGMGDDGAAGVKALRSLGASILAQDAESCVVSGMPDAARAAGASTATLGEMNALLRKWSA